MELEIITPGKIIFSGTVSSVTLPGRKGTFQILDRHAPVISSLVRGTLSYTVNNETRQLKISDGMIEMHDNKVMVCIEKIESE